MSIRPTQAVHGRAAPRQAPAQLVLAPGLMCDRTVWDPLLPQLARVAICRVTEYGDANDLEQMAHRLLDAAPQRFALAGHSMGGRVALEVVRAAPERVARLALLDTGYRALPAGEAGEEERRKRHELLALAQQQGVRAMAQRWAQGMVHPDRLHDGELIEAIVSMFDRKTVQTFAAQIHALLERPDATELLAHIRVPTLVLCGRQDGWAPVRQHEEIAARLGGAATLRVIENAGHMCTMEQPAAVAEALLQWLQR
jgi:pimeloyl-ACP methyl ester carboxylesterase